MKYTITSRIIKKAFSFLQVNDNQTISYSNIRLMNELNFLLHIYIEPKSEVTWFNETSISL